MYLSTNKSLRLITLCGLYVAQGIPWGFVTVTFAAWLAQPRHNISVEQIGPILAVATLPWSFKFVWGPLMDRVTLPRFGRRRPWIVFAQSLAILVLGGMMLIEDLPGMVWTEPTSDSTFLEFLYRLIPGPLAALILLANVFVSMQDVAVDALAVDLLKEEERGIANGLMYGSSYLGTAIGGAGLGFVVANYGIQAGLAGQALLLSLIMLLPLLFRERPEENPEKEPTHSAMDFGEQPLLPPKNEAIENASDFRSESKEASSILTDLRKAFLLRSTLLGVIVALSVKVGIGVLTAVFVDYLMKEGGWTQEEYTTFLGGYAVVCGLVAAVSGGFLADRTGPKFPIIVTSLLLGTIWISYGLFPTLLQSKPAVKVMLLSQEFLLAVLSVSLFSLFMGISWPRVAATQFTTYMALMNLSTTIGSYIAGVLSSQFNVAQMLLIAGVLQSLLVLPVLLIDIHQTRRVLGDD